MQTTVTARHCDIPEDLRARAVDVMERLAKLANRPTSADVVFSAEHQRRVVELQLRFPPQHVRVATAEAADFRTALDRAEEKLRSQLDKDGMRPEKRRASGT